MIPTLKARVVATGAHYGQTRWDGVEPYINHPRRVAERVSEMVGASHGTVEAAWLHDVIEDTDLTAHTLLDLGFSELVVSTVEDVSRRPKETYRAFILRIAEGENAWAKLVKIGDILDNLGGLPEVHTMRTRYQLALAVLRMSLPDRH